MECLYFSYSGNLKVAHL